MFYCAISGETPQDPVVSAKSGHVYERRLIQKYITDNGTDPVTGEKLEESDLVSVKASPSQAPPRPPSHASIPALLHTLQNEWDALVLETYALKQQYNSTRQELSYALYAQDAATRVVARLVRERDAAREGLASVQASMGVAPTAPAGEDSEMAVDDAGADEGLPKAIVAQIDETHAALSAARKKRKPPPGYATPADVRTYTATHTVPSLHSASPAGITALAVSSTNPTQFLTGGNDHVVQLYDRGTDKVLETLKGHTKRVNHVAFREAPGAPPLVLSAGADKLAKVWALDAASGTYAPRATLRTHTAELTGLAVHPVHTLLALASADRTYSLHDLTTAQTVFRAAPHAAPFAALGVHPDGTLLALGTPGASVQIFDVRTGALAASLVPPGADAGCTVNTLAFSENGYHLLAPDAPGSVAVWDLRKPKIAKAFALGDGFRVNRVAYDASAQLLGVAGSEGVRVFAHKTWEELVRFEEGGEVADLVFGVQGKEIWGASGREVRIWGAAA